MPLTFTYEDVRFEPVTDGQLEALLVQLDRPRGGAAEAQAEALAARIRSADAPVQLETREDASALLAAVDDLERAEGGLPRELSLLQAGLRPIVLAAGPARFNEPGV